jgi:hypothetical protein
MECKNGKTHQMSCLKILKNITNQSGSKNTQKRHFQKIKTSFKEAPNENKIKKTDLSKN